MKGLNLKQETSERNEVDTFDPHFDWTDVHQLSIWQEETRLQNTSSGGWWNNYKIGLYIYVLL